MHVCNNKVMVMLLELFCANVNAQQSQLMNETFLIVRGYDVSGFSAPVSSILVAIPQLAVQ
jgi:hypothetical protein